MKAEIVAWPGYAPTPLRAMPAVAAAAGVAAVFLKDESGRFGLGCVEALGGAYAVADLALAALSRRGVRATMAELLAGRHDLDGLTVACVADGNFGRSVAWGARLVGARCCALVPDGADAEVVAGLGAGVVRVPGSYDDAAAALMARAAKSGWSVVSDRSWPGYTAVPLQIMQAYRLMTDEAVDTWAGAWAGAAPTHAFIQARSGGVAAAVSVQLRARLDPAPRLVVVEAACGARSLLAWQELERAAFAVLSLEDGEADWGAAGLAGLLAAAGDAGVRAALGLDGASRVLLFRTGGTAAA